MLNRLKGTRAYLVGPMDFVKDRGEVWRRSITPFLKSLGIGVFDPTDKASFGFGSEDVDQLKYREELIQKIQNYGPIYRNYYFDEYHTIMKQIVAIDLRMVDEASFIIAYVNTDIHSCGTYHEIAMAVNQRKPVIVMCEQGKVHCPPWLIGTLKHEMIFSTWDEVKQYITHIDQDEQVNTLNRWRFYDYNKVFDVKDE
jgi:nucleoside 2-deoxyribosyltransferase